MTFIQKIGEAIRLTEEWDGKTLDTMDAAAKLYADIAEAAPAQLSQLQSEREAAMWMKLGTLGTSALGELLLMRMITAPNESDKHDMIEQLVVRFQSATETLLRLSQERLGQGRARS